VVFGASEYRKLGIGMKLEDARVNLWGPLSAEAVAVADGDVSPKVFAIGEGPLGREEHLGVTVFLVGFAVLWEPT
jgi:hypothetical protein